MRVLLERGLAFEFGQECVKGLDFGGRERIAFDQIRTFTLHPEAAIALANAFGVQGEFK